MGTILELEDEEVELLNRLVEKIKALRYVDPFQIEDIKSITKCCHVSAMKFRREDSTIFYYCYICKKDCEVYEPATV